MIITLNDLKNIKMNHPVGLSHGCFDLLHTGHVEHFNLCRNYCQTLVVSITPDKYARKGPGRPCHSQRKRAEIVDSISFVDYVICDDTGETSVRVIESLKPKFYFKGTEYRDKVDLTDNIKVEQDAVELYGGELKFVSGSIFSSTELIKNIKPLKPSFALSVGKVLQVLDSISLMKIAVIGETIIDKYVMVNTLGIANKYPILSTQYVCERSDIGGAYSIYKQLLEFCNNVTLFSSYESDFLSHSVVKTRYVDAHKGNKLFEINDSLFVRPKEEIILDGFDLILICDFGHGAFTEKIVESIDKKSGFLSIMCQCNSANNNSNFICKYENVNADMIVLNEKEGTINTRMLDASSAAMKLHKDMQCDVCVTRGQQGAVMAAGSQITECPAVGTNIVDTIGCGDVFFLTSSSVRASGWSPDLCLKIGNLVSYLYAQFDGNSGKVTKNDLIRFVRGLS